MGLSKYILILLLLLHVKFSNAQLKADAGPNQTICPGTTAQIGSSGATGGKPPYHYQWTPSGFISSTNIPNPTAYPPVTTTYTLVVTDDTLAADTAYVTITLNAINDVSAGNDTSICENSIFFLGGPKNYDNNGISYSWAPPAGLNNTTSPHPNVKATTSVSYTLTATTNGCPPKKDTITITVIPTPVPVISEGDFITIREGDVITLHATGGTAYKWEPKDSVKYPFTSSPDVSPSDTTKYYVFASDPTKKCYGVDSIVVFVEKYDEITIYNTFTPNGDGNNDVWYIANILKYPNCRLEIYNRYGRIVYKVKGYANTWTGKTSGEELPEATYFYILDLGDGKHKSYHGTVTIVR
jgi:gliding motility-associated-like protein